MVSRTYRLTDVEAMTTGSSSDGTQWGNERSGLVYDACSRLDLFCAANEETAIVILSIIGRGRMSNPACECVDFLLKIERGVSTIAIVAACPRQQNQPAEKSKVLYSVKETD